ncbi:MAG: hypothetical protein AAF495_03645 [Pseudomonadota bacterium]
MANGVPSEDATAAAVPELIVGAAEATFDAAQALKDLSPQFDDAEPGSAPAPEAARDPRLAIAQRLSGTGLGDLANVLFPPELVLARSEYSFRVRLEERGSRGLGVGIGIVALPVSISYEKRYGRTESSESSFTIVIESGRPLPDRPSGESNSEDNH